MSHHITAEQESSALASRNVKCRTSSERHEKYLCLESVRGIAALVVVIHHLVGVFWPFALDYIGLYRVFYEGRFPVRVFFVLSGFVLSIGYVRSEKLASLESAAVRRYFRLMIPVLAAVIFAYGLASNGLMKNRLCEELQATPNNWLSEQYNFAPSFLSALRESLWGAFFDFRIERNYAVTLWTMSEELKGSFFVFAFLALFSRLHNRWIIYAAFLGVSGMLSEMTLIDFLLGMALCDLHYRTTMSQRLRSLPSFVWGIILSLSLVFGGVTVGGLNHAGLGLLVPTASLWDSIGAVLLIACAIYSTNIRRVLEIRPFVWLGQISFPLYLLHIPIICSLGCGIYCVLVRANKWGHDLAALAACFVSIAACLLLSWISSMTIEPLSMHAGYRLYDSFFRSDRGRVL